MQTIELANGVKMPLIGLGTWDLRGKEATEVVEEALILGYPHIDTAYVYDNHKDIAKALELIPRRKFFLTSKIHPRLQLPNGSPDEVEGACNTLLEELGTDYLDLLLIHWPNRQLPLSDILGAMHKLIEKGKARAIGVSNFTINHLKDLKGPIPHVNQVEYHPFLNQNELLEFCTQKGIALEAYRTLGKGALTEESSLVPIAEAHGKTVAQVLLRWCVQQGIPVIPKASSRDHLEENLDLFSFSLTAKEMGILGSLEQKPRFCDGDWTDFNY